MTRTEYDGRITVSIDRHDGKRLNAPNDVIVDSSGAIWFTDPGYGIDGEYEGHKDEFEVPANVYRLGKSVVVIDDFVRPNGLALSPDDKLLYVVDSGISHDGPAHIHVFAVEDGVCRRGRIFAEDFAPGFTDGMRVDVEGNVWCSMGWADPNEDGVGCYAPDGSLIGKVHLPETCCESLFRRQKAEPSVHVREHVRLFALRGRAGRTNALNADFQCT